jgi:hypothetical protein
MQKLFDGLRRVMQPRLSEAQRGQPGAEWREWKERQRKGWREWQERQQENYVEEHFGAVNPALVCPHCHEKDHVRTKAIDQKKGVSGDKATGALLTGGISLFYTGLSRHEQNTQAHCDHCESTWVF